MRRARLTDDGSISRETSICEYLKLYSLERTDACLLCFSRVLCLFLHWRTGRDKADKSGESKKKKEKKKEEIMMIVVVIKIERKGGTPVFAERQKTRKD